MNRLIYKAWSRLIHRYNYHRTVELTYPDGEVYSWCNWCGLRDRIYAPSQQGVSYTAN